MNSLSRSRCALCVSIVTALLAGCGGSQPPIGAPGAIPQSLAIAQETNRTDARTPLGATAESRVPNRSWMSPNTQSQDLLYVTDASYVSVYSYPQGTLVGALTGFTSAVGACVDNSGDVFITNPSTKAAKERVTEYPHGGRQPIAELATSRVYPIGCSVDPTTGDLAVSGGGSGRLVGINIFQGAQGKALFVRIPQMVWTQFCGYDSQGNLFV